MQPTAPPLIVPDLRAPGRPMPTLPIKLPADCLASLQSRAEQIGTTRGALARTLVVQGLQRLEAAAASEVA